MLLWIAIGGGLRVMMGHHARSESLFYYFRLEDQVPESHLLRLIDTHIDFSFVHQQRAQACRRIAYASGVALVHRARFRSGDSPSLHVFEESPWAVPGIEVVRADVRTHRGPVFRSRPGARRQAIGRRNVR